MADGNPTEAFKKEVLIALKSTMSGVQDTIRALESMRKHTEGVTASSKGLEKAHKSASKALKNAEKSISRYTRSLKVTKRLHKGLYESMRGIGNIARISMGAAATATGALLFETKRLGQSMLEFKISSLDASQAIGSLESSYKDMAKTGGQLRLSIQDVAAELTKFQSKGIAQMALGMTKEFKQSVTGFGSILASALGKSGASNVFGSFLDAMGSSFSSLTKLMTTKINVLSKDFMKAQAANNVSASVASLKEMEDAFQSVQIETNDQFIAVQRVVNVLRSLQKYAAGGGDAMTRSVIAMHSAWTNLSRIVENFSYGIVAKLGPDIAQVINSLSNKILNTLGTTFDNIGNAANRVYIQFQAWGGITKVVEGLQKTFDFLVDTLTAIVDATKWVIKRFAEMGNYGKILTGVFAGMLISPTLFFGLKGVVLGLKDIVRWGLLASRSTAGIGGMLGKGGMVGIGALAAGGGHFAGRGIAQMAGADKGGLMDSLFGAFGAAGGGALAGAAFGPWGIAIGAAIASIGSLVATGIGSWGSETEKIVKETTKALQKQQAAVAAGMPTDLKVTGAEAKDAAKKVLKLVKEAKKMETIDISGFMWDLENLKRFVDITLPGFAGSMDSLVSVIGVLGPASAMFGQNIAAMIDDLSIGQMEESFKGLKESAIAVASIQEQMAKHPEKAAFYTTKLKEALTAAAMASKGLEQSLEAGLQPLKTQLDMVTAIKDLRQLDLDISQQLYGTPALAVQAQLELVKTMQMQKENLQDQLAFTQDRIALAKQMGLEERDIFGLRMKELALSKEIKSVTRDQLRQVKELRDGYISAVTAQAFGAGRFAKVLITQEQNLGRGLIQGVVKPNFLLGQAGAAAGASRADPYRFSAQGQGFLETLSGQVMRPEDIAKAVYDRVANISDPLARASALQSADIFMNIMSGANKNTKDLGNIFMLGSDRQVDAINSLAEQLHARSVVGLATKGFPVGDTLTGAAFDRGGRGLGLPPLDVAAYRKQVEAQKGSQDSIRALEKYYERIESGGGVVPQVAGTRGIDAGKANTFFVNALSYYQDIIDLLSKGLGVNIKGGTAGMGYSSLSVRGTGLRSGESSQRLIDDLRRSDKEVRSHEKAHARVAGPFAKGGPSYTYKKGPDGKRYAISGEVLVDLSPIPGDPQATIDKMQQIRKAALAPRHPSDQDLAVAQHASQMERRIRATMGDTGIGVMAGGTGIGVMAGGGTSGTSYRFDPPAGAGAIGAGIAIATEDAFKPVTTALKETAGFFKDNAIALKNSIKSRVTRATPFKIENLDDLVTSINKSIDANKGNTAAVADSINSHKKFSKAATGKGFFGGIDSRIKQFDEGIADAQKAIDRAKTAKPKVPVDARQGLKDITARSQKVADIERSITRGGGTPTKAQANALEAAKDTLSDTRKTVRATIQESMKHPAPRAEIRVAHLKKSRSQFVRAFNVGQEARYPGVTNVGRGRRLAQGAVRVGRTGVGKLIGQGVGVAGQGLSKFGAGSKIAAKVLGKALIPVSLAMDSYTIGKSVYEASDLDKQTAALGESQKSRTAGIIKLGEHARRPVAEEDVRGNLSKEIDHWRQQLLNLEGSVTGPEKEAGFFGSTFDFMDKLELPVMSETTAALESIGAPDSLVKNIQGRLDSAKKQAGEWDITALYREKIEKLESIATKLETAGADKAPKLQADFKKATDDLNSHINSVISSVQTESIQALSNVGPKLLLPYKEELVDSLDELGKLKIDLKAPDANTDQIQKDIDAQSKRIKIRKNLMSGAFGDLGTTSINEAISESKANVYDNVIASHREDMVDAINSYADTIDLSLFSQMVGPLPFESLANNIQSQFDKMSAAVGAEAASGELDKIIEESRKITDELLASQSEDVRAQIEKLRTVDVSSNVDIAKNIQDQISKLESTLTSTATAVNAEYDRLRDYGKEAVEKEAVTGGASKAFKDAESYTNVIKHLDDVIGKDINIGNLNMSELKKVQDSANAILETWQNQNNELAKSGKLLNANKLATIAGAAILARLNKAEVVLQEQKEDQAQKRLEIEGKQGIIQKQISKFEGPLKDTVEIRKIAKEQSEGAKITRGDIAERIPDITKMISLYEVAAKKDGAKVRERKEGESKEDYRAEKARFRAQREANSVAAGIELKRDYGPDAFYNARTARGAVRTLAGEGTINPGQLERSLGRLEKSGQSMSRASADLDAQKANVEAAQAFTALPGTMKELVHSSVKDLSPDMAGLAGGVGGVLGSLMSGDFTGIGEAFSKGAQRSKIVQNALGSEPNRKGEKILRSFGVGGGAKVDETRRLFNQPRGQSALPGGMPILTAVDTDQPRTDPTQELREKYGARAEAMINQIESIGGIDKRIKQIDQQLNPRTTSERGPFGSGAIGPHGFEIPSVTDVGGVSAGKRKPQPIMSVAREEELRRRKQKLEEVRDKEKAKFFELQRKAEEAGGVKQSRAEKAAIENRARKQQAAAEAAFGTGYTGAAPRRIEVDEHGIPIKGMPERPSGPPAPGSLPAQPKVPYRRTEVSDPTRVRGLSHNRSGSRGSDVRRILEQAGRIIEEIDREVREGQEGRDRITEYAGNRLFNVQASF